MFGALAMSLSSFCVVTNALRLNFVKLYGREAQTDADERGEVTLKVKGMMCENCEHHVIEALSAIEGVRNAHADHKTGRATAFLDAPCTPEQLAAMKQAIRNAGYKCK